MSLNHMRDNSSTLWPSRKTGARHEADGMRLMGAERALQCPQATVPLFSNLWEPQPYAGTSVQGCSGTEEKLAKGWASWVRLGQPWPSYWAGPMREMGECCMLTMESSQVNFVGEKKRGTACISYLHSDWLRPALEISSSGQIMFVYRLFGRSAFSLNYFCHRNQTSLLVLHR